MSYDFGGITKRQQSLFASHSSNIKITDLNSILSCLIFVWSNHFKTYVMPGHALLKILFFEVYRVFILRHVMQGHALLKILSFEVYGVFILRHTLCNDMPPNDCILRRAKQLNQLPIHKRKLGETNDNAWNLQWRNSLFYTGIVLLYQPFPSPHKYISLSICKWYFKEWSYIKPSTESQF